MLSKWALEFVAFDSSSSNLIVGDTNGASDVFLRETCLAASTNCLPSTSRVSVASDGTEGNGGSGSPSVSADGRFVAFVSGATNLVTGDTNNLSHIFVRDTCHGVATGCTPSTTRVSVASDGTEADGASSEPSISANGRFVAFISSANLVPEKRSNSFDVFISKSGFALIP